MSAFSKTPERINRIVLLNTAAFPSQDVPRRILFCRIPIIGEIFVRGFNGFAWPATWMASMKGLNKNVKRAIISLPNMEKQGSHLELCSRYSL